MISKELELLKMSSVFLEDGVLKKFRYNSNDPDHIYSKLNLKSFLKQPLTAEELDFIKTMENVVINHIGKYEIINPNEHLSKLLYN